YVIRNGSLAIAYDGSVGAVPSVVQPDYFTLDGGGLFEDWPYTLDIHPNRGITLGAAGGYLAVGMRYDGVISGNQGGELRLNTGDAVSVGSSGSITLNGLNTYDGATRIDEGMSFSVAHLGNGGVDSGIGRSSSAA